MSLRVNVSPGGLVTTAWVPPASGDITIKLRIYVNQPGDNSPTLIYVGDDPATSYAAGCWIGLNNAAAGADAGKVQIFFNSTATGQNGSVLAPGWHTVIYRRQGDAHSLRIDGVNDVSGTQDQSAQTHTHLYIATDTFAGDWAGPTFVENTRVWSAFLTDEECDAEDASATPVRTANLVQWAPLVSDLFDDSGNGNDWTAHETVDFVTLEPPSVGSTIVTDTYSDHDLQDPAEYENGFKEGRIISAGVGERIASDRFLGDWRGSTFEIEFSDYDLKFRRQQASQTDRFWTEPLTIKMTTRANRAVLGEWYTVFVGPIIEVHFR